MSKETDFIATALTLSKTYILEVGFRSVRLEKLLSYIKCSQTKFYSYFGNVNEFLAFVLKEEWRKMFLVIQSHLKKGLTIEKCLEIVTRVRDEHIGQSPLLMRYHEESNFFGKRLQALEKSVIDFEHTMLNDLLVSYFHSSNAITSAQALKTNKPCFSSDS